MKLRIALIPRISMLLLTAALTGLIAYRIKPPPEPRSISSSNGVKVATTASAVGLVVAFAMRYGMPGLAFVLQLMRAARREAAANAEATENRLQRVESGGG